MHTPRRLGLVSLLALALAACTHGSGGGGGAGTEADSVCDSDPRNMAYAAGLSVKSTDGTVRATFVEAVPAPPAKGMNAWTLTLTDSMGSPMSGATITVAPFMPDHGHGAPIVPEVTPMATAGTYQVTQLDLFMAGIWTVTFTITPSTGPVESLVFSFCIDG